MVWIRAIVATGEKKAEMGDFEKEVDRTWQLSGEQEETRGQRGPGLWSGDPVDRASLVAQMVESACSAGDLGLIPGSGRSLGVGNGNPLQYSCPESSKKEETIHGIAQSQTRQSD